MKVPLGWLGGLVRLPGPTELADKLTLAGLEVASARAIGFEPPSGLRIDEPAPPWATDKVLICRVIRVDPHPDAEKLKLPVVDMGNGVEKTVVTGAPNLKIGDSGQICVIGLTGSTLLDGHSETKVYKTLAPTKIRGVLSDAMLCSAYELGLSNDHDGLMFLEEGEGNPGDSAASVLGEVVLEIDILPNMARCLSLVGIAREVAALTGAPLTLPNPKPLATGPEIGSQLGVSIADPSLCSRYRGIILDSVKVAKSPGWMRRRLAAAGMRPISNVVDITNYVMIELGQPLHAFDLDKLEARASGKPIHIEVRAARAGEKLRTLDGQERTLEAGMLVISDSQGPIALAGVMGGADTEVTATTTRVLLEGATFDPVSIRRSARALQLHSEASQRFTKGVPAELASMGLDRAAELLIAHAGATLRKGHSETWPVKAQAKLVRLPHASVERLLGIAPPMAKIGEILGALDFKCKPLSDGEPGFEVEIPWHRLDIQDGVADLVEDIARLWGHAHIPTRLPSGPSPAAAPQADLEFEDLLRDALAGLGLREMISHSLSSPEREEPFVCPSTGPAVGLANPISPERAQLRRTLLPGITEAARNNSRHAETIRFFELGTAFLADQAKAPFPREERRVGVVLAGKRTIVNWADCQPAAHGEIDFFDLKGVLETLFTAMGAQGVSFQQPASPLVHLHPGRQALIIGPEGKAWGSLGELHPRLARSLDISSPRLILAEMDLAPLQACSKPVPRVKPVARYPAALRDIAVVVDNNTPGGNLRDAILQAGGGLITACRLFDLFSGQGIAPGKKSIAFALGYQSPDKTLTDKEIDQAHRKVEDHLRKQFSAQIRGKDDAPSKD